MFDHLLYTLSDTESNSIVQIKRTHPKPADLPGSFFFTVQKTQQKSGQLSFYLINRAWKKATFPDHIASILDASLFDTIINAEDPTFNKVKE